MDETYNTTGLGIRSQEALKNFQRERATSPEAPRPSYSAMDGVQRSLYLANMDQAQRDALDAADKTYGVYLSDLIKYKNDWTRLHEKGFPTWALSKLLSPPKPVPQSMQQLLGVTPH